MAKKCECCGKENNAWKGDPIPLVEDKILCCKCAEPIRQELSQLYYTKSKEELNALIISIIEKSKQLYNEQTVSYIRLYIDRCCNNMAMPNIVHETEEVVVKVVTDENGGGMFDNIGGKIKALAKVLTWIEIIVFVVWGIVWMSVGGNFAVLGLVVAVLGSLLAWVSSFLLYGFGQLVENSDKLVRLSEK